MPVSERRVCRVLGQHRSTQRKTPRGADDEATLTEDIIALARQYGRYGYRRVTALLRDAGWHVNRKRVEIFGHYAAIFARRSPIIALACAMMSSTSCWQLGMSLISPTTMPQLQAPTSISPLIMMRG